MKPTLIDLLRLGFRRGSRWRVLALFAGLAVLPSAFAVAPLWAHLARALDRSPAAAGLDGGLQLPILLELGHAFSESGGGPAVGVGLAGGLLLALLVNPWSAGAALAEGRAAEPMRLRGLLAASGDLWGRMVRMLLVAALPLGIAAAIAGALGGAADRYGEHALTEAAAVLRQRLALGGGAIAFFLAHLTVDAGRAQIAAQPERRSAFLAWVAGAWLVIRRPLPALSIGAAGTGLAFALAFALLALRGRLPLAAAPIGGVVLATLSTAAIAWGRSVRLAALSELAAYDAGERLRRRALRAARKASRAALTEPLLPAMPDPTPPPVPEASPPRAFDVTAPLEAPPKSENG